MQFQHLSTPWISKNQFQPEKSIKNMRKRSKMDSKNPFRVAWPKLQQIAWKSARKMAINRVSERRKGRRKDVWELGYSCKSLLFVVFPVFSAGAFSAQISFLNYPLLFTCLISRTFLALAFLVFWTFAQLFAFPVDFHWSWSTGIFISLLIDVNSIFKEEAKTSKIMWSPCDVFDNRIYINK